MPGPARIVLNMRYAHFQKVPIAVVRSPKNGSPRPHLYRILERSRKLGHREQVIAKTRPLDHLPESADGVKR